jgi:hypothetical protein
MIYGTIYAYDAGFYAGILEKNNLLRNNGLFRYQAQRGFKGEGTKETKKYYPPQGIGKNLGSFPQQQPDNHNSHNSIACR